MAYKVDVEFAPAYELAMSLDAYMVGPSHRTIDLGDGWVQETRQRLTPAFASQLDAAAPLDYRLLGLLIHQCPEGALRPDAEGFLAWLAGLTAGELYERLAPFALPDLRRTDLGALRDQMVSLLGEWHQQYFRHVEPALLDGLAADAERVRQLPLAPDLLVEEATRGYYLRPDSDLQEVRLVPQFHKRPITLAGRAGGVYLFYYPAADFPGPAGAPPVDLLRLTRTLADESRLRVIHFLAGGAHTFAEVMAHTGLTKGTVHRHLWALRFAGLVRAYVEEGTFTLRPGAFARVAESLAHFTAQR